MIGIADGLIGDPRKVTIIDPVTGEMRELCRVALIYLTACYEWIEQLPGGLEGHPPVPEFDDMIKNAKLLKSLL
jgi:hypothetical protein